MKNFILAVLLFSLLGVPVLAQTVTDVSRSAFTERKFTQTPVNAGTVTLTRPTGPALVHLYVTLTPAGPLDTLTIALPSGPKEGDKITIFTSQSISAITWTNGVTTNLSTGIGKSDSVELEWSLGNLRWQPTGSSSAQVKLDALFDSVIGNAAPVVARCKGGGDEQAVLAANTLAQTAGRRTAIITPSNCQANNQWQLPFNGFTSWFGWSGGNMDGTTMEPNAPRFVVNTDNIASNSPTKAFIDLNAPTMMSINGVNIKGSNQGADASFITNSNKNFNCCAKNAVEVDNVSFSNVSTFFGCPLDHGTFACAAGSNGGVVMLPRIMKSQFSNYETIMANNTSDPLIWSSQFSGGGWGYVPVYGGGNGQILGNRWEFMRGAVWTGNPQNNGFSAGLYLNSNNITQFSEVAAIFGKDDGWMANDNTVDGAQAGNILWNSDFSNNEKDWLAGTGWTLTGGTANAVAASAPLSQRSHTMPGYNYSTTYTVSGLTGGTITLNVAGTAGTTRSANGTYTEVIAAGTNRANMGISFTTSSFTGSIDNVSVTPSVASGGSGVPAFVAGGTFPTMSPTPPQAKNLIFADNLVRAGSNLRYGVDVQDSGVDYLYVTGIYTGANMQSAVNYSIGQPTHMVEDTLGSGANGWTGQHAERGRPFGIGTLTPKKAFTLDLQGADTVSKPLGLPKGTTAERPTCPGTGVADVTGGFRYNTTTNNIEVCNGTAWVAYATGAGSGDVVGPASSTDNAIVRFDSTSGKLIKNSGVTVDASNNMAGVGTLGSGAHVITSSSANSLAVGQNGTTNPAFAVDTSTASSVSGLVVKSNTTGNGVTITATGGTNESIRIIGKGGSSSALLDGTYSGLASGGTTRLIVDPYNSHIQALWRFVFDSTVTAGGTTGSQTINKPSGCVNFAAAASTMTVTNSMVTANSVITTSVNTNDATMITARALPSAGSFTLTGNVAATAETKVCFVVFN